MINPEEKTVIEGQSTTRVKKSKIILFFISGILLTAILLLVIHEISSTFPLILVFEIPGVLLIIGGIIYFIIYIINKNKRGEKEIELPPISTPQEIEKKIREYFIGTPENEYLDAIGRENIVKKITFVQTKSPNQNPNYAAHVELLYPYFEDDADSEKITVIVNANYLHTKPFIIKVGELSSQKIASLLNDNGINPEEDPDKEVEETENEILGVKKRIERTLHRRKNNEKDKQPEEIK